MVLYYTAAISTKYIVIRPLEVQTLGGKGDAKYLWILKHFKKCFQFLVCKWTSLEMEFISHIYNFSKGPIFHKGYGLC